MRVDESRAADYAQVWLSCTSSEQNDVKN